MKVSVKKNNEDPKALTVTELADRGSARLLEVDVGASGGDDVLQEARVVGGAAGDQGERGALRNRGDQALRVKERGQMAKERGGAARGLRPRTWQGAWAWGRTSPKPPESLPILFTPRERERCACGGAGMCAP